jgi:hypothetical protein
MRNITILLVFISGFSLGWYYKPVEVVTDYKLVHETANTLTRCVDGWGKTIEALKDARDLLEEIQ